MLREVTCIMCPRGCEIKGTIGEGKELAISGNECKKGADYVRQEMINPMRNIASSVRVINGEEELVSARLNRAIPKRMIFEVMNEIKNADIEAPVKIGDVIIGDVLGLGSDVIATKNVGIRNR